eukprot:765386-Hanusia_phi.AAC.13
MIIQSRLHLKKLLFLMPSASPRPSSTARSACTPRWRWDSSAGSSPGCLTTPTPPSPCRTCGARPCASRPTTILPHACSWSSSRRTSELDCWTRLGCWTRPGSPTPRSLTRPGSPTPRSLTHPGCSTRPDSTRPVPTSPPCSAPDCRCRRCSPLSPCPPRPWATSPRRPLPSPPAGPSRA